MCYSRNPIESVTPVFADVVFNDIGDNVQPIYYHYVHSFIGKYCRGIILKLVNHLIDLMDYYEDKAKILVDILYDMQKISRERYSSAKDAAWKKCQSHFETLHDVASKIANVSSPETMSNYSELLFYMKEILKQSLKGGSSLCHYAINQMVHYIASSNCAMLEKYYS